MQVHKNSIHFFLVAVENLTNAEVTFFLKFKEDLSRNLATCYLVPIKTESKVF